MVLGRAEGGIEGKRLKEGGIGGGGATVFKS